MSENEVPCWLAWAREIEALSQSGLTYSQNSYDIQRYRRLMEIAAEMAHEHTELSVEQLLGTFRQQIGYATPKVDVRGAVVRGEQILLVQESRDKRWCMPGGWADVGEYPSKTAEREVWEESGFQVLARKVIGVYDANRGGLPVEFFHAYKIVFLCDLMGGEPRPSDETLAVGFFDFAALPPLSTDRTNERHLAEVLAHLRDANRPTAFD